jgi:hypothetical protein
MVDLKNFSFFFFGLILALANGILAEMMHDQGGIV